MKSNNIEQLITEPRKFLILADPSEEKSLVDSIIFSEKGPALIINVSEIKG